MRSPKRPASGMSLIELLLAISILLILAGLLLAGVQQLRAVQRRSTCLSNLRQIGVAMNLYAADHNQEYCPRYDSVNKGPVWQDYLNEYLGLNPYPKDRYYNSPLWWCPSANKINASTRHYAVNIYVYDTSSNALWRRKLLAIPTPSKYVLIGETNENGEVLHVENPVYRNDVDFTGQVASSFRISHLNHSANYLFVDGHIEGRTGIQTTDVGKNSIWRWWE